MGQFDYAIKSLKEGKNTNIKPHGNSMKGIIESGDQVSISPNIENLIVGDVVLVKVKGNVYLHLIKATRKKGDNTQYQIGNNRGGINGWVGINSIYGKAISVNGKEF